MLDQVLAHLDANRDAAVARACDLLRMPSVSTDPDYADDVKAAADWVRDALAAAGLDAQTHATDIHPIVTAHTPDDAVPADAPHVLFYGHYDVQPADPIDKWTTPPFEPTVRDGKVYARGACDDKGQVCCFIEALRAWHDVAGKLPIRVTALIEGEEESGSRTLGPFIDAHKNSLAAADVVVISDTNMWDADTVAITYGLRGMLYYDLKLHGPSRDLHSGMYGGTLANPATMLTQVIGKLFDDQHRVTIPGFYDDVQPLEPAERESWRALDFDDAAFLRDVGVGEPFGEAGYDTLERKWVRPACDVNGIYGGYMQAGAKTVIPSFAGAKVSFRLAAGQDPKRVAEQFEAWIKSHDVHGCTWELTHLGEADPVAVPTDSPFMAAAAQAIEQSSGKAPVLVREGATIPVVSDFKKTLGLDSLLIGFGLPEDCIHSPNEMFAIDRFHLGCRTHAALLASFAQVTASS